MPREELDLLVGNGGVGRLVLRLQSPFRRLQKVYRELGAYTRQTCANIVSIIEV
jgi:hypothetical protein